MTGAVAENLVAEAKRVLAICAKTKATLAVAESCTGGLVAAALTDTPGSSAWFDRGFVTYSNSAKTDLLGVPADLIGVKGAVSEEVARAMAEGALAHSRATASVAITGIAGPDGGTPDKPVGTVHFAAAARGRPTLHSCHHLAGNRDAIRTASTAIALGMLASAADEEKAK